MSVERAEIVTFMQLETYFCASVTTTTLPTSTRSLDAVELVQVYVKLQYGKYLGSFVIPSHFEKRDHKGTEFALICPGTHCQSKLDTFSAIFVDFK